jgi:hypothetical protein
VSRALNLCPVCLRNVAPTRGGNIYGHRDSIRRDTCPGSGNPWAITVLSEPEFQGVAS